MHGIVLKALCKVIENILLEDEGEIEIPFGIHDSPQESGGKQWLLLVGIPFSRIDCTGGSQVQSLHLPAAVLIEEALFYGFTSS